MPTWLIEPLDSLIVRDGRPFGADPGARASTLTFPFPSTIAGAVRNRAGLKENGEFDSSQADAVKQIAVRGPLLTEVATDGSVQLLAPAPADALLLGAAERKIQIRQLIPRQLQAGDATDLPTTLAPVGLEQRVPQKPLANPPQFWYWAQFERWLSTPAELDLSLLPADQLGINRLPLDIRTHVGINSARRSALEGALYQTSGLSFLSLQRHNGADGSLTQRRLALAVTVDAEFTHFDGGIAPLGGERRLVSWQQTNSLQLPAISDELREQIVAERSCRLILLTPALFRQGYLPSRLFEEEDGCKVELVAAALGRGQTVSGWDLLARAPKPTRRPVSAGAVYFLKFPKGGVADPVGSLQRWISRHWMSPVSDDEQDRRDGFGLAVLGRWQCAETLPKVGG